MIHQYINNDIRIVMDINSGSVHVADAIFYDAVAAAEPILGELSEPRELTTSEMEAITRELISKGYARSDIESTLADMQKLIDAQELFTTDTYVEYIGDIKKRPTVVKALCLNVAHDCNLACRYCFAGKGEYGGKKELMSFDVGKRAIDFLVQNSGNRRNLEIDFFGGEPLMNFDVVRQLVAYGRSLEGQYDKKFRFTMTTNGMLLNDEIIDYCNKEMKNVVLSLDGTKTTNDYMRPTRNGKGSYDVIVPKFQEFAKKRGDREYYIRGTFTRHNLDFAKDVIHFADLGFDMMSIEPVVGSEDDEYAIRTEDLPIILDEYDKLAREYIKRAKKGRGFTFFHFLIDLEQGPCVAKRLSGCGSGTEYLAITPNGDMYPCHQFVGEESFIMGNVYEGLKATDLQDEFKASCIYTKPKCQSCFARYYCSGGCGANSYKFHGSINDTYDIGCEMEKKRVECAIMIKAALA
jgi:uncharacterized protein